MISLTAVLISLRHRLAAERACSGAFNSARGPSPRSSIRLLLLAPACIGALLLTTAPPALAAKPESPELKVSEVNTASATLAGTLNPKKAGEPGTYHFAYRPSTKKECKGAGELKAPEPAGAAAGAAKEAVSALITALSSSTEYTVCLVAENAKNEATASAAVSFKTTPLESPEVLAPEAIKATEATTRGVLSPKAPGELGAEYQFVYRASKTECKGAGELKAPATPGMSLGGEHEELPAQPLSGLTAGTEYTVCLAVTNAPKTATVVSLPVTFRTATPPATPKTDPPTEVSASTATLNGVLNPTGAPSEAGTYEFVYRQNATECQGAGEAATSLAATAGKKEAVSAKIEALAPGAQYTYCLIARNAAGELAVGAPVTISRPPAIESAASSGETPTSAELTAKVNPDGAAVTECRFEYGTTTAYTEPPQPCEPATIPSGTLGAVVSRHLEGLTANTPYHWRLVVTSTAGTTTTLDHTFIYDTTGQGLPDRRAYEMVTPVAKNGAAVGTFLFAPKTSIAADGSRVIAITTQCFGDAGSCTGQRENQGAPVAFTRTPGGWVSTTLAPSATQVPGVSIPIGFNADLGTALFGAPTQPAGEDDWYARTLSGDLIDIGPINPPSSGPAFPFYAASSSEATADLSHLAWTAKPLWPFDATTSSGESTYQYAGSGNFQPSLVGVTGGPGSTDLISVCNTTLGLSSNGINPNAISQDGSTVYFTANACASGSGANAGTPVPAATLYARIGASRTVDISEPSSADCSACNTSTPSSASYVTASDDGSKVFFTTTQPLLGADSTENLYEFDLTAPAGQRVTRVSAGDPAGANVQGPTAVSADGSHVYFVAAGMLTSTPNSQGQTASEGANNLYAYDANSHQTKFIAALPNSDSEDWLASRFPQGANVTPDGRFLVFTSRGHLTADDTSATGAAQVFRYDDQTGQLTRISIGTGGFNDNGNAAPGCAPAPCPQLQAGIAAPVIIPPNRRGDPTMSDSGSRVFFMSPLALTPRALDAAPTSSSGELAQNVYEWEQPGAGSCPPAGSSGCVYLISDGKDVGASATRCGLSVCLLGADTSGDNVFFTTSDALVPQDTDGGQLNFYDARVDGGFPAPPTPTQCENEGCQGAPTAPPAFVTPGSTTISGIGNLAPLEPRTTPRPARVKHFTNAQKLTKALRTCHEAKSKRARISCEKTARAKYGRKLRAKKTERRVHS